MYNRAMLILSLLLILSPVSYAHSSCESQLAGVFYEDLLAEPPEDDMGMDFALGYSDFAKRHKAEPGKLVSMTTELFGERLALAAKYKTFFATQMTTLHSGQPYWKARLNGISNERAFSFGIRDNPRSDIVWRFFKENFKKTGERTSIDTRGFPLYPGERMAAGEVIVVPYDRIENLQFKMFVLDSGYFYLEHAPDLRVPELMTVLSRLWDRSLDIRLSESERLLAFCEFEWLWFWTNPFGRGGASIGATMALLWEVDRTLKTGQFVIRRKFYHQDLEALSRTLPEYIEWRMKTL